MKREVYIPVLLTKDEEQEFIEYYKQYIMRTGELIKRGPLLRKIILDTIRNGKPDNEQTPAKDDKPPAEQPAKNPFADINF